MHRKCFVACAAWALALSACDTPAEPRASESPPPTASTGEDETALPLIDPASADEPTPVPVGRVREALGEDNVAILEHADGVEIGRMQVTAVLQAQERWLANEDQIAGHPLIAPLRVLGPAEAAALVPMLLDEASYDFETQRRCLNELYVGLRFTRGRDIVELALGMPCTQTFFVYRDGTGIQSFGGLLDEADARRLVDASE